jgi:hypothetical protein
MCSYNRINSVYSCENNVTLNTYLKVRGDWGGRGKAGPALLSLAV